MHIKLVVFDLDGTLADTSPGILECHRYANVCMGKQAPSAEQLDGIIGGALLDTYRSRFGFSETEAKKAVSIYREHYKQVGTHGTKLYNGMLQNLTTLRNKGYLLAVATLKEESLAKEILEYLGISVFFDTIHGMDKEDTRTKSSILEMCMSELGTLPENTLLVGDSIGDLHGAQKANVHFAACLYGFGFSADRIPDNGLDLVIDNPLCLAQNLCSDEKLGS